MSAKKRLRVGDIVAPVPDPRLADRCRWSRGRVTKVARGRIDFVVTRGANGYRADDEMNEAAWDTGRSGYLAIVESNVERNLRREIRRLRALLRAAKVRP